MFYWNHSLYVIPCTWTSCCCDGLGAGAKTAVNICVTNQMELLQQMN